MGLLFGFLPHGADCAQAASVDCDGYGTYYPDATNEGGACVRTMEAYCEQIGGAKGCPFWEEFSGRYAGDDGVYLKDCADGSTFGHYGGASGGESGWAYFFAADSTMIGASEWISMGTPW